MTDLPTFESLYCSHVALMRQVQLQEKAISRLEDILGNLSSILEEIKKKLTP